MDELVKKLLALAGQGQPPPTPAPGDGINAERPWDSEVFRPPVTGTPITAPATRLPTAAPQVPTPEEEALIQALRKKGVNQQFAQATHNPIPG